MVDLKVTANMSTKDVSHVSLRHLNYNYNMTLCYNVSSYESREEEKASDYCKDS